MKNITKDAYERALEVLEKVKTPHGFDAAYPGYDALWSRDSMITSLGASLIGKKYQKPFAASLKELAKNQSAKGQIPNAVDTFSRRKPHVDYKSIDSTLWWIIGQFVYAHRYANTTLLKRYKKEIQKAYVWLSYQDMGEDSLLEQQPTSDWFDAFPHRYGHTINTQALYYHVLQLLGEKTEAARVKKVVNTSKDDGLWNGKYYIPWRWKNHNAYKEKGEWFDSKANMLAILYDLADKKQSMHILEYVKKNNIAHPYPMKALSPPIRRGTKDWQDYFLDSEAGTPDHYSNGGIWTFIGGFYVCALVKLKQYTEAEMQLTKLAEANIKRSNFVEWLHGKTGKPGNSHAGSQEGNQAWNAGMYIAAYESVKQKKCLV